MTTNPLSPPPFGLTAVKDSMFFVKPFLTNMWAFNINMNFEYPLKE